MVLEHNSSLPLPPPPLCLHTSLSLSLGKLFHNTIWHFAGPLGLTHTSDDSHRFWGIEVIQILPIGCWNSGAGVKVQVRSSCSYVIPQPGHPSLLSFISFFFFFHSIFLSTNVFESNYSWDETQGNLWLTRDFYHGLYYLRCPLLRHYYVPGTGLSTSYASVHLILKANLWSLGAFHIW